MGRLMRALKRSWPELAIEAGMIGSIVSLFFIPSGYHADLLWIPIAAVIASFALFSIGVSRRPFLHSMLPIVRPASGAFAAVFVICDMELYNQMVYLETFSVLPFLQILIFIAAAAFCVAVFMVSTALGLIAIRRSLKKYA